MIQALSQQVENGIKLMLGDDDIEVKNFNFYHVVPNNVVIAMVTATDDAVFMVSANLETGEGSYAEFPADELQSIRGQVEAESPGASLAWIGETEDGEFAFYKTAEGEMRSLKTQEYDRRDDEPKSGSAEPDD